MKTIYVSRNGVDIGNWPEEEFREKVFRGEILTDDYYFIEGMTDWKRVAEYRGGGTANLPPMPKPVPTAAKSKKESSPAQIGATCAIAAVFMPILHEACFFLVSLPLLMAAFILAIVSIVRGRVGGGILLLAGLIIALPTSCSMMVDRDKILHHPEQLRMTVAQREAETRAESRDVKMNAEAAKHWVNIGMTMGQCRAAWGEPTSITRTGSGDQNAEHWLYGDKGAYLYFENGILKSWQD